MKVYVPAIVHDLESFYGGLLWAYDEYPGVKNHLNALANKMLEGVREKNEAVLTEINNYHPDHLGRSIAELATLSFGLEDCRHTIANEYGFPGWPHIPDDMVYDQRFEASVDHLLSGNLAQLRELLERDPGLIGRTSSYGHQATLLHYAGSNGVELWRQRVPYNLPEIVSYLLEQGAEKKALMNVYGGGFTALQLMQTSAHPNEAGLAPALEVLL